MLRGYPTVRWRAWLEISPEVKTRPVLNCRLENVVVDKSRFHSLTRFRVLPAGPNRETEVHGGYTEPKNLWRMLSERDFSLTRCALALGSRVRSITVQFKSVRRGLPHNFHWAGEKPDCCMNCARCPRNMVKPFFDVNKSSRAPRAAFIRSSRLVFSTQSQPN